MSENTQNSTMRQDFEQTGSTSSSHMLPSLEKLKADEPRLEHRASRLIGGSIGRLRASSLVTLVSMFRSVRTLSEQVLVLDEFQHKLRLNSDNAVAIIELVIILLSCVQLDLSIRSARWRENNACARLSNCVEMDDEGSFIVSNCIRVAIGLLGIVRMWIRIRFLLKQRPGTFTGTSWFKRTTASWMYIWEFLAIVIFPYPGLETFLERNQGDVMIYLSIAVGVRTICWRHILYFPYPIREKSKVANFAGNLHFSYRAFVFKKVMDDHPIRKIVLVSGILFAFATFLVHAFETINCACAPFAQFAGELHIHARELECVSMSWGNTMWLVSTSFVNVGFGDVMPTSQASRAVLILSACVMRIVAAMLVSIVIKKSKFSTMEARVHAFLFRMDLFNKKDVGAVMAVQASYRFAKSYRRSLMWHKHSNSLLYYRPLSARLPNEVKKKLYLSRFQATLKEIMKFNTDGDPMNAFIKHIEVITAALGITLVEMAQLKRIRVRAEKAQKRAIAEPFAMARLTASPTSPPGSPPPSPRQSACHEPAQLSPASPAAFSFSSNGSLPEEWGQSMVTRCEQVLAQLYHIEQSARSFPARDRSNPLRQTQPPGQSGEER